MKTTDKIVAYLRVSTKEQGIMGYGLEAQKELILKDYKEEQIAFEYSEIASGNDNFRPKLKEAIDKCEQFGYTLVVAKLDRLGRNVSYLFEIKERVKNIRVCNMPGFDTLQFGIYATIAQHERELISTRTKDALHIKKLQGYKLGTPGNLTQKSRDKSIQVRKEKAMNQDYNLIAKEIIKDSLDLSLQKIADKLNRYHIKTAKGKQFTACTVSNLIKLYDLKKIKHHKVE